MLTLEEFEKLMKEKGQPVQDAVQGVGSALDARIDQAKKNYQMMQQPAVPETKPDPRLNIGPTRGNEQIAPPQPGFNASQVQGLEQMARLKQRDALMKQQLEQEAAAQAQSQTEFDPSSYEDVPKGRFNGLSGRFK